MASTAAPASRTSVSIPLEKHRRHDAAAELHQMSRSEFYTTAGDMLVERLTYSDLDSRIAETNDLIDRIGQPDTTEPAVAAGRRTLGSVEW
jgi:hypothetical protein